MSEMVRRNEIKGIVAFSYFILKLNLKDIFDHKIR